MTIVVLTLAVINTIALICFGYVLSKIYEKISDTYLETLKSRREQLEACRKLIELHTDVISLDTRFDGFETEIDKLNDRVDNHLDFVKSADDNIAEMRMDIQKILDKFDEDAYHYINATTKNAKDIDANLILDSMDYSALYSKLFSKQPPLDTHLDDQKGDEVNEQT